MASTLVTKDVLETLARLLQLDVDALGAYDHALQKIDDAAARMRLEAFRREHDEHVGLLAKEIRRLGGEPPARAPDLKGYLLEGLTALRSASGAEAALRALKTIEELTNARYQAAMTQYLPDETMRLVQSNWVDEQKHLRHIVTRLERPQADHRAVHYAP